ncbi:MAG: proline racemase family protein [Vicinamibacterales bacterium]
MPISTIDAHVCGSTVRLIVDGFPSPRGTTMAARLASAARRADAVRQLVVNEPRGHAALTAAVLTEPGEAGADAGVLFMDVSGFKPISLHGLLAVATVASERGLVVTRDADRMVIDTADGSVQVRLERGADGRVLRACATGVASFVMAAGVDLSVPGRRIRADLAYGGGAYAIVDAETAGVVVSGAQVGALQMAGLAIANAIDATVDLTHPGTGEVLPLDGVVFTAPPRAEHAGLMSAVVRRHGGVERSPSGRGTAALMAVLDAMGLLAGDGPFVHEGLTGLTLAGQVASRTRVGQVPAIVPEIAGSAFITGVHTFEVSADDPLRGGFRLS